VSLSVSYEVIISFLSNLDIPSPIRVGSDTEISMNLSPPSSSSTSSGELKKKKNIKFRNILSTNAQNQQMIYIKR
jgi:hypothetical protein